MNLEELRAPLSHRAQLQRYEEGRGPPDKGFRPGGRRSFDSWQVGVSIDSLFEYGRLFLVPSTVLVSSKVSRERQLVFHTWTAKASTSKKMARRGFKKDENNWVYCMYRVDLCLLSSTTPR